MPKYKVTFAHMDDLTDVEEIMAGWGEIDITTDVPVETQEQLKEIARTIGHQLDKTRVGILKIDEIEGEEDEDIEQI